MIKVILLKNCEYGENGAIVSVKNNEAHTMIEQELAKLYKEKVYEDKMMRPRVYKTRVMKPRAYKRRAISPIPRSTK